jgi:hypothetical protein
MRLGLPLMQDYPISPDSRETKRRRISPEALEDDISIVSPALEKPKSPTQPRQQQYQHVSDTSSTSVPTSAKIPLQISSITLRPDRPDTVLIQDDDDLTPMADEHPNPPGSHDEGERQKEEDPYAYLDERAKALKRERELAESQGAKGRADEPIIELLIDSHLPEGRHLLVKIRYSQKFKEVRQAFCKHNSLAPDKARQVMFTWKGLKVYDGSSCKDLSVELNSSGLPVLRSSSGREESADKLTLVATTKEIDQQEKAEAAQEEAAKLAALEAEASGGPEVLVEKEKEYRIVLRSKGFSDYKLKVKASTEIEKIMGAFSRHSKSEKTLSIQFDGEELSPDMKFGETEVVEAEEPVMLDVYER